LPTSALAMTMASTIRASSQSWAISATSALVGSLHEVRSNRAIARLREQVASRADVWRDGRLQSLAADEVVPGDIVELSAGSLIPADG
ncbi:P-type ATPase, partial [Stutzerimonas stutzeri]|uniref:P-type ATPase n=1 Tax=Stutzerimonas stutzeri TaxID=316 RepID=UPI0024B8012D